MKTSRVYSRDVLYLEFSGAGRSPAIPPKFFKLLSTPPFHKRYTIIPQRTIILIK
jgi:hypothetical protein